MTGKCLAIIFNMSLKCSQLPDECKLAHVAPLHKTGVSEKPNNYRPISLTSIPCKLMQHIVLHCLNNTLDKVLCNWQHGFRKNLICEAQLYGTCHELVRNADKGDTTHAVVLDFSKAFDKVPHSLLMQKNLLKYPASAVKSWCATADKKLSLKDILLWNCLSHLEYLRDPFLGQPYS